MILERLRVLLCIVCLVEVTTNNSPREVRAATKAWELENMKDIYKSICVYMLVEIDLGVEHFAQQNWNNSTVSQSSSSINRSSIFSLLFTSYQPCQSCYLIGESPHTGNFTVHLQYPLTVQSTIFLFQMKPQLPHCWFSTPLCCSLSLFSERCVTGLWFSHYSVHRKCVVAKQVPVTVSTPHWGPQS